MLTRWSKTAFKIALGVSLLTWILANIASKSSTGKVLTQNETHWANDAKISALIAIALAFGSSSGII